MSELQLDNWLRQLLAELAAVRGAAVPLRPVLEKLAGLSPQQRFERVQWLVERVGVEVVWSDGEYCLVAGRPGRLSDGEWVDLAAAVAEAAAGTSPKHISPDKDYPEKSSTYESFPFRYRSVETYSGRSREYQRA